MTTTPRYPLSRDLEGSPAAVQSYLQVMKLLWPRRRLIASSGAVGMILAAGLAFVIPKQYKSTTQLMPPDSASSSSSGMAAFASTAIPSALSGAAGSLLGIKSQSAIFVKVLRSRTVGDDLINQFDLRRVYHTNSYEDARMRLASLTIIDNDKDTGSITITVKDNDPYRARDIAAAYTAELNKVLSQLSTSSARRESIFLQGRLESIKADLDSSSQRLSQFSSRNATMDVATEGRTLLESAAKSQEELIAAESELSGLQAAYGPGNVRIKASEARVAELRRGLKQLAGTGNEDAKELRNDQLYPSIRKLPLLGSTYADLYRSVELQEAVYEMLTKQYELAKVQEAKDIPSVKVLDPPDLAERKSFPPRLFSAFLAAMWVLAEQAWYSLSADDPRKKFILEILGANSRKAEAAFSNSADT